MDRRNYLSWVAAGVLVAAGCLGRASGGDAAPLRNITAVATTAKGVDFDVEITQRTATTVTPATVQLEWANSGKTDIEVGVDRDNYDPIFSYNRSDGESTPTGLVLIPVQRDLEKVTERCWKPVSDESTGALGRAPVTILEPGEQFHNEYEVWTSPNREGCLPPGTHKFGPAAHDTSRLEPPFWGLTLEVEDVTADRTGTTDSDPS